ncbi:ribosome biogenesis GTPase Der [Bdellovibrio bacteriovorus]|uniref:ribosome biogenesis GTPase Der n=1 Tax=Bdellovibrio bacteriovorus TaxID=959 RepID=UPI0021D20FCB|nr:ribosome biogenesis GTPase Der [Bdellovibrio bacteriovorus]UXR63595.1 ribosome biogenesis GTPase Der [Bdellovibrio bacteriovorus]
MSLNQRTEFAPKVAIIGRPNVGKSTLFNIITDTRKAVVKNQAGVTRDIIIEPVDIWGKQFDLIDTGGITEAGDIFSKLIKEQVTEFLHSVDLIVAVMDGRAGLVPEDRDIIRVAKQTGKPFLLVINKVDRDSEADMAKADFYEFGVDIISASFEQRRGVADVLEWITKQIPENPGTVKEGINIAIVGKPNVGKSSLCNAILGVNRMIVSDVAGTTIDSVDSPFVYNGKKYTLVDTAGLRRSAKREEDLEIISAFKSQEAIRRADLILLVVDGTIGPTDQDARIMQSILEDHKGVIVVANKSDLGGKEVPEYRKTFRDQIERVFHFFTDVNVVFTSAKTQYGLEDMFEMIERVADQMTMRIPTAELNDFFFETIRKAPAPVWGTTNVKFYYLTQTYQRPPAFIAFANHPDGVTNSYRRFLIKNIKERWDLHGMPIRIFCMKSRRGGSGGGE